MFCKNCDKSNSCWTTVRIVIKVIFVATGKILARNMVKNGISEEKKRV